MNYLTNRGIVKTKREAIASEEAAFDRGMDYLKKLVAKKDDDKCPECQGHLVAVPRYGYWDCEECGNRVIMEG